MNYTELKRLADAAKSSGAELSDLHIHTGRMYTAEYDLIRLYEAVNPAAVLALIAENEALAGVLRRFVDGEYEQDENQAERHMYFTEAQSLLALASGELEAHTIVPDSAIKAMHAERDQLKAELEKAQLIGRLAYNFDGYKALLDERDQLRAEVAGLKTGYEAYERVNAELKAECEALRKDADRYRWLRQDDVEQYHISTKCSEEKMDAAIDAAMGKGEKS